MAQMETLDSSCKEICVLQDVYLVSSLGKSGPAPPALALTWSRRRAPAQHPALPRYRYALLHQALAPGLQQEVRDGADDFLQL